MKALVAVGALISLSIAGAQAQECQSGIDYLNAALSDTPSQSAMAEGPARQEGEAAREQPQHGDPTGDPRAAAEGPSRQSGETAEEQPQQGNPRPDQSDETRNAGASERSAGSAEESSEAAAAGERTSGPSRQGGSTAEEQPQAGNPLEAEEQSGASGTSPGDRRQLSEAERMRLGELRQDAMQHAAAGREDECLEVLGEAEAMLR